MSDLPPRRWRIHPAVPVVGVVVLIALIAATIYAARTMIAERLARQWLADHRTPADVQVRSLSLTGFSASLRLGNLANPDLVVDRLDVGYSLSGPWVGRAFNIQTRSVRLYRPQLRAHFANGKLDLGVLTPLIQALSKRPSSGAALPDVSVQDGSAILITPGGVVTLHGDGATKGGVLETVRARLDPFALTFGKEHLSAASGALRVDGHGGRMTGSAKFQALAVSGASGSLQAAHATLAANLPAVRRASELVGAAHVQLTLVDISAKSSAAQTDGARVDAAFDGDLNANGARQTLKGRLTASGAIASIGMSKALARDVSAKLYLPNVIAVHDANGFIASGAGDAGVLATKLSDKGAHFSDLAGSVEVDNGRVVANANGVRFTGSLQGHTSGRGGLDGSTANTLARKAPILSGEAPYRSAISGALTAFKFYAPSWQVVLSDQALGLHLSAPLSLNSLSGAHVSITGAGDASTDSRRFTGAGTLRLDGGGLPRLDAKVTNFAASPAAMRADLAVEGVGNALFARGLIFRALGRAELIGPRFHFTLSGCAPVTAVRLAFVPNPLTGFRGQICPSAGSLIETWPGGWRSQGAIKEASSQAPSFAAQARAVDGTFDARGRSSALDNVSLVLGRAMIADTTQPIRFRPLSASGRVDLARGVWDGNVAAATAGGRPVGSVHIHHETSTGVGRADIDASALVFAPGSLEPSDLTPMAQFAKEAQGRAAFTGFFAWGPAKVSSSGGELTSQNMQFKSPLGPVLGIDADLKFISLSPLVTAPDQHIAVHEVQALLPVTALSAVFDFNAKSLSLDTANAGVAQGHVRLEPLVAQLGADSKFNGVLVLDHINVGQILATSSLADSVKMDAVVDGRIPFEYGPSGLHILQGHLAAVAPGRISISRKALGDVSTSVGKAASPGAAGDGFAQNLAYQAVENLAFDELDATMNSLADNRLGILFHIKGRHDPPQRTRATIALSDVLSGHALRKPIDLPSDTKINLTLDTTLNFGELVAALENAWRASLGQDKGPAHSGPVHAASP